MRMYVRKMFPGWSGRGRLGFAMPYITHIHVENCRNVKSLDVDLSPDGANIDEDSPESTNRSKLPFRHLILTGPNGSGKSGVLEAISEEIRRSVFPEQQLSLPILSTVGNSIVWSADARGLPSSFARGELISVFLQARRKIRAGEVRGPLRTKKQKPEELTPAISTASSLHQFMVNKHVDMTYARASGNDATADRISAWFDSFVQQMQRITEDSKLTMTFEPQSYEFEFRRADGYVFGLSSLADGYAAILALLAELFIRVDTVQVARKNFRFVPNGVVLVDEIETHLHLSLQEQILPFLIQLFPQFQFIVATHSPAVIASIPDAVVYDLRKQKQFLSSDYQGIPYGVLMTEHFGISSDIDLDSTGKLIRFRTLAQQAMRTPEETTEMDHLAAVLSARSQILATEVWMVKERLGSSSVQLAGENTS